MVGCPLFNAERTSRFRPLADDVASASNVCAQFVAQIPVRKFSALQMRSANEAWRQGRIVRRTRSLR